MIDVHYASLTSQLYKLSLCNLTDQLGRNQGKPWAEHKGLQEIQGWYQGKTRSEKTGVTRPASDILAREEFVRDNASGEVDTNDATTKSGLLEDKGNLATDNNYWNGKPEPVVSNAEACESNAWLETCKPSKHEVTDESTAQAAKAEVILNAQRFA